MTPPGAAQRAARLIVIVIACTSAAQMVASQTAGPGHPDGSAAGDRDDLAGVGDLSRDPGDLSGAAGTATCRHWPSLSCGDLQCSGRGVIDCRDRQSTVADDDVIHMLATSFYYHLKSTLLANLTNNNTTDREEIIKPESEGPDNHELANHGSLTHGPVTSKSKGNTAMADSQPGNVKPPADRRRNRDLVGMATESAPRMPAVVGAEPITIDAGIRDNGTTRAKATDNYRAVPAEGAIIRKANKTDTADENISGAGMAKITHGNDINMTSVSHVENKKLSLASDAATESTAEQTQSSATVKRTAAVATSPERRLRRRSPPAVEDTADTEDGVRSQPVHPATVPLTVEDQQELKSETGVAIPVPSKLIFGKVAGNSIPRILENGGRGQVSPVDLNGNTMPRKKLLYKVVVQAGVNVTESERGNPSTDVADESIVTWIKPLEEPVNAEIMSPFNREVIDKENVTEAGTLAENKVPDTVLNSSTQQPHPISNVSSISTAENMTKTTVPSQLAGSLEIPIERLETTTDEMEPLLQNLSDDTQKQTMNNSLLPEQLEKFQQVIIQIMQEDNDFQHADKEEVRALLLQETQFPYLAGTVQGGGSGGTCTLYNITCQPQPPLLSNCSGVSPVVCVDLPAKTRRARSGVFHLVLQLLVGACVLFLPLIWIVCRKQPNEVVANGNI